MIMSYMRNPRFSNCGVGAGTLCNPPAKAFLRAAVPNATAFGCARTFRVQAFHAKPTARRSSASRGHLGSATYAALMQ